MQFEVGEYAFVKLHKNCKCRGKIMRLTPLRVEGDKFPSTSPDEWFWCDGKMWDPESRVWNRCGASSLKGDRLV